MTQQEEIREGLTILISECYSKEGSACKLHTVFQPQKFLNKLFPFLHEYGVVVKVDTDSLICEYCEGIGLIGGPGINDCCPECNGTGKIFCYGYVAVKPLIKE